MSVPTATPEVNENHVRRLVELFPLALAEALGERPANVRCNYNRYKPEDAPLVRLGLLTLDLRECAPIPGTDRLCSIAHVHLTDEGCTLAGDLHKTVYPEAHASFCDLARAHDERQNNDKKVVNNGAT